MKNYPSWQLLVGLGITMIMVNLLFQLLLPVGIALVIAGALVYVLDAAKRK